SSVLGIDNDQWCIDNSLENLSVNNCTKVSIELADVTPENEAYDIILANINKNVLLHTIPSLEQLLANEGVLVMSGLLSGDEEIIVNKAESANLSLIKKWEKDNWIALEFKRK